VLQPQELQPQELPPTLPQPQEFSVADSTAQQGLQQEFATKSGNVMP